MNGDKRLAAESDMNKNKSRIPLRGPTLLNVHPFS